MIETQPITHGIEHLKSIVLEKEQIRSGAVWLTDLDGTVKEKQFVPETIAAFKALHRAGVPIGIATDEAFSELMPWIQEVAGLVQDDPNADPFKLFNGIIIAE